MSRPRDDDDEEAATITTSIIPPSHENHYHDDFSSDDDATIGPEAPLRPPSTEFEHSRSTRPPNWLSQTSKSFLPPTLRRACIATGTWIKGPKPPRIYTISPVFPSIQSYPITLLSRFAPKRCQKIALLLLLYAIYIIAFALTLRTSLHASRIPGYGTPVKLGCGARYWGEGNACGIDGVDCRPFSNSTLAFRCPADCHKQITPSHHAVGDGDVRYAAILVGGPGSSSDIGEQIEANAIYRSDSFICSAAIHSGYFPASTGGCGVLALMGEQTYFQGSVHHGLTSLGFDSYFPHTFAFLSSSRTECADLRWPGLAPTLIFTTLISLFTTSPAVHFWSIFPALFFHVSLLSDPPPRTTFASLLSLALGRFLPAAFCAWVVYRYIVLRSLTHLRAQIEKTILWLGAAWVGALNNYTFDRIPIQRLTAHDLRAQPGAIPALIGIVGAIFIIALGQAWAFRVEGRMPRYLAIYGIFVGSILIMLTFPGLKVRIHHYVLGLVLLPGTSFQNRPSLVYQGLLLGLFVNGVGRWGFASVLETEGSLVLADHRGTLLPAVSVIGGTVGDNITFGLGGLPVWDERKGRTYDGVSALVNDVERFRGFEQGDDVRWTWERYGGEEMEGKVPVEYFRFAYVQGSVVGDYTKAGKWDSAGRWIEMGKGAS